MPRLTLSSTVRLIPIAAGLSLAACANLPGSDGAAPATTAAATTAPAATAAAATSPVKPVATPPTPMPPPAAVAAARPASSASGAAATPPVPGQPPAFAVVIKDAKKIDGLITVYQKDDKFWFELKPEDFGKPYFLSPKLASGIGENGLYAGMMQRPQVVEFRRIHNQVQLIARNTSFVARAGTPESRSIASDYSPSLLASTPVASLPHPERKTVLVEVVPLFINDMLGVATGLGRTYRQNYNLDRGNSAVTQVRGKPDMVAIETLNHYATASISQPTPGAPPGVPQPTVPRTLPDARSLFLNLHYSIAPLPATLMKPRLADGRIGHFVHALDDFSDDLSRTPRLHNIARWRLEKKDPAAELSEPVKPITYWIDRSVPLRYRDSIRDGILEWNKAFEKVGFKNAVQVQIQPDNADFDTLDFNVASVRWMNNASPTFGAIGPRHVDPRSGEILDADILFEGLSSRNVRNYRSRIYTDAAAWGPVLQIGDSAAALQARAQSRDPQSCEMGELAAEQLAYGLDVLAAQGEIDPDSPEAREFVLAYVKDVTMHEVGHTLGLRHNFRASRIYSEAQIADPEFSRTHATSGSVMEYLPINLPRPGERRPAPFQTTLGPYDYWAIEYAYKPIAPEQEAAELARIAARSAEPELAYGTDEDNFLGLDPESLQNDLGSDPLVFARKRFEIAQDLFKRQEARTLSADQDYGPLRRALRLAVIDAGRAAGTLMRQIGGVRTLRDHPGTGRDPLQPVPAADQRAALDTLARHVLAADSLIISPALARRLAPDFLERTEAVFAGDLDVQTDYPLAQTVHALRTAILGQLMSDTLAQRVIDSEGKMSSPAAALHLSELYRRLDSEVWSELGSKADIPTPRRELQRDYVNRLSTLVLRPGALTRTDARSMLRTQAADLLARVDSASKRPGLSNEARLHLKDSADTLRSALAAPLQRAGA